MNLFYSSWRNENNKSTKSRYEDEIEDAETIRGQGSLQIRTSLKRINTIHHQNKITFSES